MQRIERGDRIDAPDQLAQGRAGLQAFGQVARLRGDQSQRLVRGRGEHDAIVAGIDTSEAKILDETDTVGKFVNTVRH
ncbi:hypothetical protein [Burkholderia gladioli]|uniref:hypothetical protein n=1 Tax=Burkholderia gladioli TaxID=28095 RepID=UPI002FE136C2